MLQDGPTSTISCPGFLRLDHASQCHSKQGMSEKNQNRINVDYKYDSTGASKIRTTNALYVVIIALYVVINVGHSIVNGSRFFLQDSTWLK